MQIWYQNNSHSRPNVIVCLFFKMKKFNIYTKHFYVLYRSRSTLSAMILGSDEDHINRLDRMSGSNLPETIFQTFQILFFL